MAENNTQHSQRPVRLTAEQAASLFRTLDDSSSDQDSSDDFTPQPVVRRGCKRSRDSDSDNDSDNESADVGATPTGDASTSSRLSNTLSSDRQGQGNWDWQKVETEIETQNHFRFTNLTQSGLSSDLGLDRDSTPMDVFTRLMSFQLIMHIVSSINDYAKMVVEKKMPTAGKYSFANTWHDLTVGEFYKFLAVITEMGLDPRKSVKDYFSTRSARYTAWYHDMFPRNRFEAIFHTALHVGDVESVSKHKIEPFINQLVKRFQDAFYPFEEVSIDEMVVGFQGRFTSRQYNPSKPDKYHIKNYGLCDSRTGYVYNLFTYYGTNTSYSDGTLESDSHAVRVFDTLLGCLHKGHHIYADRYYTSSALLEYVIAKQFNYTGTVNTNRKNFPADLKKLKLQYKEAVFFHSSSPVDALCVAWRDKKAKKPCVLVTTKGDTAIIEVVEGQNTVQKPGIVDQYNRKMNGCDKADQMVSYYSTHSRKTRKWWKKLFYWILEVTEVNAHIIYTLLQADDEDRNKKKMSLKTFKEKLSDAFVAEAAKLGCPSSDSDRSINQRESNEVDRVSGLHLISYSGKDRDCVHCSGPGKRKRSTFVCGGCSTRPHLCPKFCFEEYHKKCLP